MTEPATTSAGPTLVLEVPDRAAYDQALGDLVADRVASRLAARDHTLWGAAAESEAAKRLGWVDLARTSRPLVPELLALREEYAGRGLTRIVLCGMGGSSLAPEVICASRGTQLTTLDSSDPDAVRSVLDTDLDSTVVVVSSKSGGTVETDSHRRAFAEAFRSAGIDPAERIVVVTDPGSPLEEEARAAGYRVFLADPEVGGRYSALTAFGLVPTALAGVDIAALLDEASAVAPSLSADSPDNPALQLGALLGTAQRAGVDKLVLADSGSDQPGFGDWVEQLIAESTGKEGKGVLPVVVEGVDAPNFAPSTPDEVLLTFGPGDTAPDSPASGWAAHLDFPLGAHMQLWETTIAVAGRVIGINPFDQPDVESAKQAARDMLSGGTDTEEPRFVDGEIEVYAGDWLPADVRTAADAVRVLREQLDPAVGYLAVQAYLDRWEYASLGDVRAELAEATGRPVTFGWGPRFLHSTGQYHKGGPAQGVFLQLTGTPQQDLAVPGRDFSFGEFILAQATGDASVLAEHGRPVLRLHAASPAAIGTLQELLR